MAIHSPTDSGPGAAIPPGDVIGRGAASLGERAAHVQLPIHHLESISAAVQSTAQRIPFAAVPLGDIIDRI